MTIRIGNAPCSWGVEFPNDPRNPEWRTVLKECAEAGYKGIELGPIGFMPEDPEELGAALKEFGLELIGGVVFQPFHDPAAWERVKDAAERTCKALVAHGAKHFVLIDSISPRRAPTAGRPEEAEQMGAEEWAGYVDRFRQIAEMGKSYGLIPELHPHAGGFMDFEPEVEKLLAEITRLKLMFALLSNDSQFMRTRLRLFGSLAVSAPAPSGREKSRSLKL